MQNKLEETLLFLHSKGIEEIEVGLILGSGLGELGDEVENPIVIPYETIPNFPVSTVKGHAGCLVYGDLSGKKVLAMQGRFHYYEGYSMKTITYPVLVMKALGAHSIIVTNACGGVNENFKPGDLMIIKDHINYMGDNPLIGKNNEDMGPRFPDMTNSYTPKYRELAKDVAKELGLPIHEGVYMAYTGPIYETPAEIRMSRILGADTVGMSTVPEVIAATHAGLNVLGISCITNLAAGMQESLNHEEVVETTIRVKEDFKTLIKETLKRM